MDWKNKLKQTGIRLAKQELNKSKSKKNILQDALQDTVNQELKKTYSSSLNNSSRKLQSSKLGIISNKIDIPQKIQNKIDSQVDRAVKSFKTPSTKSEIEKQKKDIVNKTSNSDIGKKSISIKSHLEDKKSNSIDDLLKRSVKDKLSEMTNGVLDVNRKSPTPKTPTSIIGGGGSIGPAPNIQSNPWTVKQRDNFENKPIKITTTTKDEPKLTFKVIDPKSPSTESQNKQSTDAEGNKVNHSFTLPVQSNALVESHSFTYDAAEKTFMSKDFGEAALDTTGGLISKLANKFSAGKFEGSQEKLLQIGRKAVNPNIEQIFKNVDVRAFTFEFLLFPKNETEYDNYLKAIHMFKYWSHPPKTSDFTNKFLDYPAYWKIDLHLGGADVYPYVYTRNAYCNSIDVKWAGGSEFILNNKSNAFSAIELKMDFIEVDILTREDIHPSGKFISPKDK